MRPSEKITQQLMCCFIGKESLVDVTVEPAAIPDHHHVQHLLPGGILQPWIV